MPIEDLPQFDRLCSSCGITLEYYDIAGQRHAPEADVRQMLLAAMGYPVTDDAGVTAMLERVEQRRWLAEPPPVQVFRVSDAPPRIDLVIESSQLGQTVAWEIVEESGRRHRGEAQFDGSAVLEEAVIESKRLIRVQLELPAIGEPGYHQLELCIGGADPMQTLLVATPSSCYQQPQFDEGRKVWGLSLQLYTLRSRRNWGIGDFTDLQAVAEIVAPLGADLIGLNPLHALFPHLPENASPYSPSSRDFLNPIYLDIEAIDEFGHCEAARELVSTDDFQANLQRLRDVDLVDYGVVWSNKLEVLRLLYACFHERRQRLDHDRFTDFTRFRREQGKDLFEFALFEALQAHFYRLDNALTRWQDWPDDFRDPQSAAVMQWAERNNHDIEFHMYLQWNAAQQLATAQQHCQRLGMGIGLYRDLAVGNEKSSAQRWADPSTYASNIGIGAPADDFNPNGQNWDLPAPLPQALQDQAYAPFVRTLRANMQHSGALRIDHIMGLMRLFWVPSGYLPKRGTYVAYPFEDLLGILTLESQRNRCLVIGEDLGTVPDEVRHALYLNRILSYRIFRFEKDWHKGSLTSPEHYPRDALCTGGSHDLPTLVGYWRATDLELRDRLELHPSPDIGRQQTEMRERERSEIVDALAREELLQQPESADAVELSLSIQRYLARSRSIVMMLQVEDLLLQEEQVNVPGTVDEYPNWRLKLAHNLEDWVQETELERIARLINRERNPPV